MPAGSPSSTRPSPGPRRRRHFRGQRCLVLSIILTLAAGAFLLLLQALPYSTSAISPVSYLDLLRPPNPDFALGRIRWTVSAWSEARELEPLRQDFLRHCANAKGLVAALCVSDRMARAFPNGEPLTEPFDPTFDPAEHLRAHSGGRPGHCVTRSAILAAELLAVGIPARAVQILGPNGPDQSGHTAVEIWDSGAWALVDSTYGRVLRSSTGAASAWALVSEPEAVHWQPEGVMPAGSASPDGRNPFAGGTLLYPEPWLYLRAGPRAAPWPFRARFARAGNAHLRAGRAQTALVLVFLLCSAGVAVCWTACGLRWIRDHRLSEATRAAASRNDSSTNPTNSSH